MISIVYIFHFFFLYLVYFYIYYSVPCCICDVIMYFFDAETASLALITIKRQIPVNIKHLLTSAIPLRQ